MNLSKIVWRNVKRRRLSSALTAISVSLGVALFVSIGVLRDASEQGFQRTAGLCDTIVGAKGDGLQLSLNTLYHMGFSAGNISLDSYQQISKHDGVEWAVPIALGDSYRGYRIVGVSAEFFDNIKVGDLQSLRFDAGDAFDYSAATFIKDHLHMFDGHGHHLNTEGLYQAVVGAEVAKRLKLKVGDQITPAHGVEATTKQHHEATSEIVGILATTGTPIDRAIYLPIISYYLMEGHESDDHGDFTGTRDARGISAIMMATKSGYYRQQIYRAVNNRLDAMAVFPSTEMKKLFSLIGNGDLALRLISLLVIIVALVGVLVSLYNAMGARRKEFAIFRALGASRLMVLSIVSLESSIIACSGALLGLLFSTIAIHFLAIELHAVSGVTMNTSFGANEIAIIISVTFAGAFAGLIPALEAYRTEASQQLSRNE
ncbi:MAG: ABC transporter permease [Planctomycetes bacterium]|nr:ABC transporter permease [Planctomycetota bacterium]